MAKQNGKKSKKIPKQKKGSSKKEPRSAPAKTEQYFKWKIVPSIIDMGSNWGWHDLAFKVFVDEISQKLHGYETMLWEDIKGKDNHSVDISSIVLPAQAELEKKFRGDIPGDKLFSLRITAKQRVWGFLDRGVLKLLWWDPHHEICPTKNNRKKKRG